MSITGSTGLYSNIVSNRNAIALCKYYLMFPISYSFYHEGGFVVRLNFGVSGTPVGWASRRKTVGNNNNVAGDVG